MTSQTLINNRAVQFSPSAVSSSDAPIASPSLTSLATLGKLPYQANHQVELLHLQAETEVLLQEIQTVKQQRSNLIS
ncbi:MAG: hypothetical protein HC781_06065 [Leptolyngbyaceae cyanobacterium CSU_1_4]|nr:hypothetical protein [Leptolyngbyaceae cyanobacterium CSU_1_4]